MRVCRVKALALLAACAIGGLMSACSAGRVTQTANMAPAVPGFNADADDRSVSLRDVLVVNKPGGYGKGETAPLSVHIVNNLTDRPVKLTQVTVNPGPDAPVTGTVCLVGGGTVPTGAAPTPSAEPSVSASAAFRA